MAKLNKKVFLEKFLERHPSIRWVHEIKDPSKLSPEELEEYEEDIKLMRDWYATEIFEEQQLLQDQEESKKMEKEKIRKDEEFEKAKIEYYRTKGRQEGFAQGRYSKSVEAARKMLSLGLSDEIILEVSGIARVELKKMKNEK